MTQTKQPPANPARFSGPDRHSSGGITLMISENLESGWLAQSPLSIRRPDREETSLLGAHVPKSVHRLIKLLAAEESTTVSALLCEAVALIIEKYGRAPPPALELHLANRKDGRRIRDRGDLWAGSR